MMAPAENLASKEAVGDLFVEATLEALTFLDNVFDHGRELGVNVQVSGCLRHWSGKSQ